MYTAPDCQSYYVATVNESTRYPELKGEEVADVCVIGGGYTGVSSALRLAEKGYSVALIESNSIGWGASGRNGGQLLRGLGGTSVLKKRYGPEIEAFIDRLRWRGNDIVEENIKKYDIECDLKYGYIDCAFKDRQMRYLEAEYEEHAGRGMGDRFRLVSADEMNQHVGTSAYKGGLYNDRDGHLHPLNLCRGEARAAAGLGAKILKEARSSVLPTAKNPKCTQRMGLCGRNGNSGGERLSPAGTEARRWCRVPSGDLYDRHRALGRQPVERSPAQ